MPSYEGGFKCFQLRYVRICVEILNNIFKKSQQQGIFDVFPAVVIYE